MADPVLHIQDSYYFEIPKALWPVKYESLDQVPEFLREAHADDHLSLQDYSEGMSGKILIPQPFGAELKNLYEVKSGFGLSKLMVLELAVALILVAIFIPLSRKIGQGSAPKGKLWNLFETILVFFRDEVARPLIGHGHNDEEADKFLPFLWTLFFFVLGCNLMGMLPWLGSPTAELAVTLTLAIIALTATVAASIWKQGVGGFVGHFVPNLDMPIVLKVVIVPLIAVIEVASFFIKHGVLAVRLLANMAAGHIVLFAILGLAGAAVGLHAAIFWSVASISILGATVLSCLELFVAFLQAYIFVFLSAMFIGSAMHHH